MTKNEFLLVFAGAIIAISSLGWIYFQSAKLFFNRNRSIPWFSFFSALFFVPILESDILFVRSLGNNPFIKTTVEGIIFSIPIIFISLFIIFAFIYYLSTADIGWEE